MASSPYTRRSFSISMKRSVSPKRILSPTVGPNRLAFSLRDICDIRVLSFSFLAFSPSHGSYRVISLWVFRFGLESTFADTFQSFIEIRPVPRRRAGPSPTVYQVVEPIDALLAPEWNQCHFLLVAWLEAQARRGRNIQTLAKRRLPVKFQGAIDLKEMKMRADLDGTVTGVAYLDFDGGAPGINFNGLVG